MRLRRASLFLLLILAALLSAQRLGAEGEGPAAAVPSVAFLEAELEAAQGRDPYMVLDPAARTLEVRARGIILHVVALEGVALLAYRPLRGPAPAPQLPMVLTVDRRPEEPHRRRIAPRELRPFDPAAEEETAAPPDLRAAPDVLPDPPAAYRVGLEGEWDLEVVQGRPEPGLGDRLARTLADGWARLWRRSPARPHLLVLAATADDGRRLHHLFREGIRVLVVS